MNTELKPCPFCGGRACWSRYRTEDLYWVQCADDMCGASLSLGEFTQDEAAAKWNRRAEPTTQATDYVVKDKARVIAEALIKCINAIQWVASINDENRLGWALKDSQRAESLARELGLLEGNTPAAPPAVAEKKEGEG